MSESNSIFIKGARVNNLKNIDVEIPRDKLVVITGLSGSGKSSLAFDTLYAEGQRRYVESLSAYARQFLGRMSKPECDYIKGIPPAIAIEQKVNTRNPRSTVGTSTEIYEYLRLLYARIGKTISPVSGEEVKKHQVSDIVKAIMAYPEGTRFAVYAPVVLLDGRSMKEQLEILRKEGYTRLSIDDKVYRIADVMEDEALLASPVIELLIDRLTVSADKTLKSRLADSAETAFFEGHGMCIVRIYAEEGTITKEFSKKFEMDGIVFEEPTDMMFSFNNPLGACPVCEGFGKVLGIDENLVVPDKSLSVYQGAVVCWKGEVMSEWLKDFVAKSEKYKFPIHRPYYDLTDKEKDLLWHGAPGLHGIDDFFKFVEENLYKIQYRVMQARYRGKTVCPVCKGSRLKPEALYVQIGGKNIAQLVTLPITEAKAFFDNLQLNETETAVSKRLLTEINSRLQFLVDVGLGYLTLDRLSSSLSGGESQRINLATSLGSSLVGSLYILDEPSIGLHSRDTGLLINVLRQLQALGNTVVVVEHDEEIIRAADYIIDIGPKAGRLGGEVVYQGAVNNLKMNSDSYTVRYLTGEDQIEVPPFRRLWNNYISVKGARKNNLKGIDVKFPLNVMTVVSGVSGSGKSSLVRDIFYEGVKHYLDDAARLMVDCSGLEGDMQMISAIEFVDQNSIGKSSRSNPVTYIGAYDEIRKLFADQPLSKQMGYSSAYFSFNKEGGRCEECKGEGKITVEMQFMADITLECEACHGKRFKAEVLDVEYRGANIYDVLEMTVNQAIEFFEQSPLAQEKKIVKRLKPLQDVGLGYIKLGQTSSTLSGGENQRVKLAYYLGQEKQQPALFVFDEPTTGLHFHDIKTLLKAFNALIEKGHTVVIVEHNMDVIKCADYVIDLGPEGGKDGGYLVCAGTPEEIITCKESYTGKYLREKLEIVSETVCK
ncbi:excinuclease ABC subunit UvrA [Parabacteroides bouchesdurhonensis]|uniref:excinuclease ABC subunit UvrA n=1 Tax=Parabacteroides bouchesdurhonensis TaxID=1936995 RepID=UPI000E4A35BD|nr:excinuclease ABC subunit UvrA [Parabacteroides bouchesdurhonensis]RHJ90789.1 excinuclease ABC subunit A [Bacteroides sp. AM07-16]